jgi:hypothetical protein
MTSSLIPTQSDTLRHLFGPCVTPARTVAQPRPPAVNAPAPVTASLPAARAAADAVTLLTGDQDQVEDQVVDILAASQRRTTGELAAEAHAPDGGIAIDSMSSVFVYSIIRRAVGTSAVPKLGKKNCEPADFLSTRALARLVCRLRAAGATV